MAHNLNFNQKSQEHAFFGVKEKAWHGLGQIVEGALTSEEAIRIAHLDYDVYKGEIFVKYPSDIQDKLAVKGKLLEGNYGTFRSDNGEPLGIVGSRYEVIQNTEAFSFFDEIVGFKEAIFETAGALGKGETIFISAKLPKHIKVANNDVVDRYLLFTNTHDGTRSVEVLFTPIRVVCNNTLQMALGMRGKKYKIRHTKSAHDKVEEAKQVLQIENTMAENVREIYKAMTGVRMSDRQAYGFINSMFLTSTEIEKLTDGLPYDEVISSRKRNIIGDVQKYYHEGPGQNLETAAGTLWGVYNSISGYYNNVKEYKNYNSRMENIIFNTGVKTSEKAFEDANKILTNPKLVEIYN